MATKKIKFILKIKDLPIILIILIMIFNHLENTKYKNTTPVEDKNTKNIVQHHR